MNLGFLICSVPKSIPISSASSSLFLEGSLKDKNMYNLVFLVLFREEFAYYNYLIKRIFSSCHWIWSAHEGIYVGNCCGFWRPDCLRWTSVLWRLFATWKGLKILSVPIQCAGQCMLVKFPIVSCEPCLKSPAKMNLIPSLFYPVIRTTGEDCTLGKVW